MRKAKFVVGPNQGFAQAWTALLTGRLVRRAAWPDWMAFGLYENGADLNFCVVDLTEPTATASQMTDNMAPLDILAQDWEVLGIIVNFTPMPTEKP